MSEQTTEVASAVVRFMGDLKPLEKAVSGVKKSMGGLEKTKFGGAISNAALSAGRALLSLAKNAFYVREAIQTVIGVARKLADAFLAPAMTFEKTALAIEGITGSTEKAANMMGMLNKVANQFGLELAGLQEQAVSLTVISEGDVAEAERYAKALARINSLRPDLPQQRQLGVIFALKEGDFSRASMLLDIPAEKLRALAGVAEETSETVSEAVGDIGGGGEEALGKFTSIVREAEGAGATGKELADNLKKGLSPTQINALLSGLGASDDMMKKVSNSMIWQLQKLQNHWLKFRQTLGMKVLHALAGPLDKLLTWLEANEEMVVSLAEKVGEFLAGGIEKLVTWLEAEGFEKFQAWLEDLPALIQGVVQDLEPLINFLQNIGIGAGKSGPKFEGSGKEKFGQAAGYTATHPGQAFGQAATTMKQLVSILAFTTGSAMGGQKKGLKWFEKVSSIPTAAERQKVEVVVGADPRTGTFAPYVKGEIGRNNDDLAGGLKPSAAWGAAY